MIQLTEIQRQAIVRSPDLPPRAIDPATSQEYVLVRAEVYDRLRSILADDGSWPHHAYLAAMDVFARDGWDDPKMDIYDSLLQPEQP